MINRAALFVRSKKPFLDWAAGLDDSGLLPDVDGEPTVYLIPDYDVDARLFTFQSLTDVAAPK